MSRRRGRRGADGALVLAALAAIGVIVLLALTGGCDLLDPARRRVRARIRDEITRSASERRWFRRSRERALVGNYDVAPLVVRFYGRRGFNPAWCTGRGPKSEAFALAGALDSASSEGLEEEVDSGALRTRLESLESGLLGPGPEPAKLADLDLWLTRSFFKYAAHLSTGRLDPARLPADWHVHPRRLDLVRVLERGLRAHDLPRRIAALRPPEAGYARLRDVLERDRAIARAGGWPLVTPGPPLRRGSAGPRVRPLSERLALEGDLDPARAHGSVFDAALASALRRFQARHGLDTTGVAGPREFAELNVPASARVRQIELNLERWRWLPDTLGDRYVLVNVPAFALEVHEGDRVPLRMRVVVGRELSRTPLFSDSISSLVFHPSWDVPPDIAVGEMLLAAQKDPGYFAKNHLRVYQKRGREARELDPATVDWRTITPAEFHFTIKQDPGPDNAVGRVIFMCPNPYSIYLHDTPAGHLFSQTERDFSHGCIRVEKPLELAECLLRGKRGWDSLRVARALDSLGKRTVFLPRPVPLHVLYWTAWVDENGRTQLRRDVYGLDSLLTAATS
ncbi:MAG TPA: L,D-transpeptidase family protein, partial [Terriglobales bacterium]|nr:L,D-transpeptidase family protein [Terriglobales bacterium]